MTNQFARYNVEIDGVNSLDGRHIVRCIVDIRNDSLAVGVGRDIALISKYGGKTDVIYREHTSDVMAMFSISEGRLVSWSAHELIVWEQGPHYDMINCFRKLEVIRSSVGWTKEQLSRRGTITAVSYSKELDMCAIATSSGKLEMIRMAEYTEMNVWFLIIGREQPSSYIVLSDKILFIGSLLFFYDKNNCAVRIYEVERHEPRDVILKIKNVKYGLQYPNSIVYDPKRRVVMVGFPREILEINITSSFTMESACYPNTISAGVDHSLEDFRVNCGDHYMTFVAGGTCLCLYDPSCGSKLVIEFSNYISAVCHFWGGIAVVCGQTNVIIVNLSGRASDDERIEQDNNPRKWFKTTSMKLKATSMFPDAFDRQVTKIQKKKGVLSGGGASHIRGLIEYEKTFGKVMIDVRVDEPGALSYYRPPCRDIQFNHPLICISKVYPRDISFVREFDIPSLNDDDCMD